MKNKTKIAVFLCVIMILSISGIGCPKVEAAKSSRYFISQDICYKVISKNKAAVCGLKLNVDKNWTHWRWKSDTLQIPSYTTYKGTKYKVTEIADYDYSAHFAPKWDTEDYIDGKTVGINLPEYRGYSYLDLQMDYSDFKNAENIKTVILPDTLNYIGEGAFCGMPKLEKVVFADKYKKLTVGMNAFSNTKIKSITFPKGTYELKQCAAGSIPTIYIPSSVKKIGSEVVNADTKKVVISKKNKSFKMKNGMLYSYNEKKLLGASANVKSVVTVSKKTKSIARNVFSRTKVKQVNLNNKINTIPKGAFAYCKKLTKVTGTKAVSKIDYAAFAGCSKLTDIGNMPKLKSIGRAAFWQNKKLKLNLTSTIKDIDTYAFAGTQYTSKVKVKVEDGNQTIFVKDGILIKKDGENQIVLLQVGKKIINNNVVIPEGITSIPVTIDTLLYEGELILPTTLKIHDAKILGGEKNTVVYQTAVPPVFGRYYELSEYMEIQVPKGSLDLYKSAITESYYYKEDGFDIWKDDNEWGTLTIKEQP